MSLIDIDYIIKQKPLSYIFGSVLEEKNISRKDLHIIVLVIRLHLNNIACECESNSLNYVATD